MAKELKYPEWTPVMWDGNRALAEDGTIYDCWRKSFRHGHVSVYRSKTYENHISITYSFGPNSDYSMSGGVAGTDVEAAKKFVDVYVGEGYHFRSRMGVNSYTIWDSLNSATDLGSIDGILYQTYERQSGKIILESYRKSTAYHAAHKSVWEGEGEDRKINHHFYGVRIIMPTT